MWFENQFPYFLWMVLCGAGIMFFYDFLRISRRIAPCPAFLLSLEDIIFAILSSIVVFYVTYVKNNGEIRWQTALGLIFGCVLYILIIRNRFVKAGCWIWKISVKAIGKILRILIYPIKLVIKILSKPARVVIWYSGKGLKRLDLKAKRSFKHLKFIMRKK